MMAFFLARRLWFDRHLHSSHGTGAKNWSCRACDGLPFDEESHKQSRTNRERQGVLKKSETEQTDRQIRGRSRSDAQEKAEEIMEATRMPARRTPRKAASDKSKKTIQDDMGMEEGNEDDEKAQLRTSRRHRKIRTSSGEPMVNV